MNDDSCKKYLICVFARRVAKEKKIPFDDLISIVNTDKKNIEIKGQINFKGKIIKCTYLLNTFEHIIMVLKLYDSWKNQQNICVMLHSRKPNCPEGVSERIFCFVTGSTIIKKAIGMKSTSFDAYNVSTGKTIQLKTTSSDSNDLTSFGPDSKWDELYFMSITTSTDSFKIWKIDNDLLYNCKVNATQTFRDCQATGKRPRLSIFKEIINKYRLKPLFTGII